MKMRKFFSAMLSAAMIATLGLTGCSNSNTGSQSSTAGDTSSATSSKDTSTPASTEKTNITVWAPEEITSLTQSKLDAWIETQSDFKDKYTITVSAMGEGEAATQLLTDVEAGADVYGFAQD